MAPLMLLLRARSVNRFKGLDHKSNGRWLIAVFWRRYELAQTLHLPPVCRGSPGGVGAGYGGAEPSFFLLLACCTQEGPVCRNVCAGRRTWLASGCTPRQTQSPVRAAPPGHRGGGNASAIAVRGHHCRRDRFPRAPSPAQRAELRRLAADASPRTWSRAPRRRATARLRNDREIS